MDNRRVGDRVDYDKVVVGESYMYLTLNRRYIPLKVKSIRPFDNYLIFEFTFNKNEVDPSFSNFTFLNPLSESPFFMDLKEMGRNLRNTKLLGLSHGPESIIGSYLTGIEGKNAYQQEDELKKKAGIQGPHPKRTQYSGRKTRRKIRSKRTRSKKYKR
jgi:hypothetical protein